MGTKIEWCEETWNPITGCSPVSEGCEHCYARRMANRLKGRYGYPEDDPFRPGTFHPEKIDINLWPPGKRVFVCSMGDIFHKAVTREMKEDVYRVIDDHPDVTFLFLTKRPQNVMSWWIGERPNVWLGVTVESNKYRWRLDALEAIPAAVRFVSIEPMLAPIYEIWEYFQYKQIHWVIVGGETGPGARPMHPDWIRKVRDDCVGAGVPFFFKHWGEWAWARLMSEEDKTAAGKDVETPWRQVVSDFKAVDRLPFWEFSEAGLTDRNPNDPYHLAKWRPIKVGKKNAGRLLDGREWNEFPSGSAGE